MRVKSCTLRQVQLPLREPIRTSYGEHRTKDVILVTLETNSGSLGIAECVAMASPSYTEETVETAWHVLQEFLLPTRTLSQEMGLDQVRQFADSTSWIRGNSMAKAGLEMALWDAFSAESQIPLHELIGGQIRDVEVGISLGMDDDLERLRERVLTAVDFGYRRIKLKIAPGQDIAPLRIIRDALPNIPLMADANSAYHHCDSLSDNWIQSIDDLDLSMIEQPLGYDDMIDHAYLQSHMQTPICLDESIRSAADVRRASAIGACRIVNLKPGRVGGFTEAVRVHDMAKKMGIGLWCGGMYETGIGRLHNLALCSLPGFNSPTDNGPSDRYFEEDIVDPPVQFKRPGYLQVESLNGVAHRVNWNAIERRTVRCETFSL